MIRFECPTVEELKQFNSGTLPHDAPTKLQSTWMSAHGVIRRLPDLEMVPS